MSTQLITQDSIAVPQAQQQAWIKLAHAKNKLTADLTQRELTLQGLLLNPTDLPKAMADYRKAHTEMVDARKAFTNVITAKLIEPLMEYEKRADPKTNAAYLAVQTKELEDRKSKAAEATKQQDVANERAAFKAHFANEYMALATKYRHALAGIAQQCYIDCLSAKTPPDQVAAAISVAELAMGDVKPGSPNKFNRVHLTPEDAAGLYKQLKAPEWSVILSEAKAQLKDKFALYANDLANAEAAVQDSQRSFQATIVEEVQDLAQEQAANVLMASAEAFIIPEGKGVKTLKKMVILDDSEQWIVKVMGAFLANFATAFPKTKNKKYSSLSVAQMAAALDAAEVTVAGVEYQTIEK